MYARLSLACYLVLAQWNNTEPRGKSTQLLHSLVALNTLHTWPSETKFKGNLGLSGGPQTECLVRVCACVCVFYWPCSHRRWSAPGSGALPRWVAVKWAALARGALQPPPPAVAVTHTQRRLLTKRALIFQEDLWLTSSCCEVRECVR